MSDINVVVITGRLTRDAEIKYTPGGMAVGKLTLAVNKYDKRKKKDMPSFFDVVLFGKLAESLASYLLKGSQITVSGELKMDRWNDKEGNTKSKISIIANTVQLLGKSNNSNHPKEAPPSDYEDDIPF
ncbi:MAG: single-stranded DNA-binding protein [Spirochaetota bacterium]|nr:single-stranded DNA-binding protein [Spirochaetota bacterium]